MSNMNKSNLRPLVTLIAGAVPWNGAVFSSPAEAQGEPDIVWQAREHSDRVWTVAFSPDGALLASGGEDGAVNLFAGV